MFCRLSGFFHRGLETSRWLIKAGVTASLGDFLLLADQVCYVAQASLPNAQHCLGCCYSEGLGVEKDPNLAFMYYKMSADQGYSMSQYTVAICLESGLGVQRDDELAFKYFSLAAEQGHSDAQYSVGCCLCLGQGCVKDESLGIKFYQMAAEQGNEKAQIVMRTFNRPRVAA